MNTSPHHTHRAACFPARGVQQARKCPKRQRLAAPSLASGTSRTRDETDHEKTKVRVRNPSYGVFSGLGQKMLLKPLGCLVCTEHARRDKVPSTPLTPLLARGMLRPRPIPKESGNQEYRKVLQSCCRDVYFKYAYNIPSMLSAVPPHSVLARTTASLAWVARRLAPAEHGVLGALDVLHLPVFLRATGGRCGGGRVESCRTASVSETWLN